MRSERYRNLGPVSVRWLRTVGVRSRDDLERLGPVEVFLRVRDAGFKPSLNLLWSLQGAVLDVPWTDVPADLRHRLRSEVEAAERAAG